MEGCVESREESILKDEVMPTLKAALVKFDILYDTIRCKVIHHDAIDKMSLDKYTAERLRAWASYGEGMILHSFRASVSKDKAVLRNNIAAIEDILR